MKKPPDPRVTECLKRAAEWRLIGLLFERPREGWAEEVASVAGEVTDETLREAAAATGEATEGIYHTLLGPGGPAPPREVSYNDSLLPGAILGRLTAYYAAFAFAPEREEAPDHVAVQANFMGYLALKEGIALADGDPDKAAVAAEAAAGFRDEHLRTIAEPLAFALEQSGMDYLDGAAKALLARTGPAPVPMGSVPAGSSAEKDSQEGGCTFLEDE